MSRTTAAVISAEADRVSAAGEEELVPALEGAESGAEEEEGGADANTTGVKKSGKRGSGAGAAIAIPVVLVLLLLGVAGGAYWHLRIRNVDASRLIRRDPSLMQSLGSRLSMVENPMVNLDLATSVEQPKLERRASQHSMC